MKEIKAISRNGEVIQVGMWANVCSETDSSRAGKHRFQVLEIIDNDTNPRLRSIKMSDGNTYDGYSIFSPSFE